MTTVASRWKWMVPGLFAGVCVSIVYLATHPYPAFGAGLYLYMSEQVFRHPFQFPEFIPHYTERGVPFAYPPFMLYVNGLVISWLNVDPFEYARYVPTLVSIVALVPFHLLAEELLESPRSAGFATVLAAVTPPVLQWHISAGGIVRAPAYLFTLAALYSGLRLFRSDDRRWLAYSILWFTLTTLTHPIYTAFVGLSYIWMWVSLDRSATGLVNGATVAVAGGLLTSPWWTTVIRNHGVDVFLGASSTHGGIGHGIVNLLDLVSGNTTASYPALISLRPDLFDVNTVGMMLMLAWTIAILLAWVGLLVGEGYLFLPGWLVVVMMVLSRPRFPFLIGTLLIAAAFFGFVLPGIDRSSLARRRRAALKVALVAVVVVSTLAIGVAYAGSNLNSHGGSESLPQFVDEENEAAMEWVVTNTARTDTFVVLGDVAEWFPYVTRRTILTGSWGVEWRGGEAFDRQRERFNRLSTCVNAACVTDELERSGTDPDYLYVPRRDYTVRGMEDRMSPAMRPTLIESPRFTLVYQSAEVMIFEYTDPDRAGSDDRERLVRGDHRERLVRGDDQMLLARGDDQVPLVQGDDQMPLVRGDDQNRPISGDGRTAVRPRRP